MGVDLRDIYLGGKNAIGNENSDIIAIKCYLTDCGAYECVHGDGNEDGLGVVQKRVE